MEPQAQDRNAPEPQLASIIVPAFNEGDQLAAHLAILLRTLAETQPPQDYEIIVVDDGSTDNTHDVARRAAFEHANIRVVRHAVNRGLGCAIRTGFAAARGYAIVVYDSDLSYDPHIIQALLDEMAYRNADIVLASPYMRGGSVRNVPWIRRLLSREANRFLSFATNGRYATVTCMVRAYRREFLQTFESSEDRMEVNIELLFKAIKRNANIAEIPARLEWSARRADSRARMPYKRTFKQILRTFRYGVAHRPAVLLSLPGILPGVLPTIVAIMLLAHASVKTIAIVTLITMIIQNASLALFAGQLTAFFHNAVRRRPNVRLP